MDHDPGIPGCWPPKNLGGSEVRDGTIILAYLDVGPKSRSDSEVRDPGQ